MSFRASLEALAYLIGEVPKWPMENKCYSCHNNGDAVILLHGLGDHRLGMQGYAEMFLNHGYSVLMPDARAHGLSGGIHPQLLACWSANDIRRWFEWTEREHHPACIFGLGNPWAPLSSCRHRF